MVDSYFYAAPFLSSMLPITNPKDSRTLKVIAAYCHAGGHIKGIKNMQEFCKRYEIDVVKFEEESRKDTPELLMFRLEKAGLV